MSDIFGDIFGDTDDSGGGGGGSATRPVVSNLEPAPGQPVYPDTPIMFDVTDTDEFAVVIPMVIQDPFKAPEPTHNTETFEPLYAQSTRVEIANGFRFTLRRTGGWVATPRLLIWAVDAQGAVWTGEGE